MEGRNLAVLVGLEEGNEPLESFALDEAHVPLRLSVREHLAIHKEISHILE